MTSVVLGLAALLVLAFAVLGYVRNRRLRRSRAERFQRHLEAQAAWEQHLAATSNNPAQGPRKTPGMVPAWLPSNRR